jgi:cell division protease FtsH
VGNKAIKTVVFWVVVGFAALLLWQVTKANSVQPAIPEISYSQFMSDIDAGDVARVTISGNQVRAQYRAEGGTFRVTAPHSQAAMLASLQAKKAEIWIRESEGGTSPVTQLLGTWAPLLLLGGLWFFMIRQMRRTSRIQQPGASSGIGEGLR